MKIEELLSEDELKKLRSINKENENQDKPEISSEEILKKIINKDINQE